MTMKSDSDTKRTIKVLLVEDLALLRTGLEFVLKRAADLSVVGLAANGEEAVKQARSLRPNVILMDVGMPLMDGIEAAKKILAENPAIKIIMLTQRDNDSDVLAALAAGASGYCLKDVEPERLYTAIRCVNTGDAWIDATIASRILKHFTVPRPNVPAPATETESPPIEIASAAGPNCGLNLADPLSPRELEVLKLIVEGLSNQQIADRLVISLGTAKTHVYNILNKLAVDRRTEAAVIAMRHGII